MELDEKIAEITMEPKTNQVINLTFRRNSLRFRCRRCAVFCCKLGSPKLLAKDIECLKRVVNNPDIFLVAKQASLKDRKGGSCIFLLFNVEEGLYQCSVYDYRPTFCRLYPFHFEKLGPQSYALKFVPCCNGLNTKDGDVVDENFFVKSLQKILFDLIDSYAV